MKRTAKVVTVVALLCLLGGLVAGVAANALSVSTSQPEVVACPAPEV